MKAMKSFVSVPMLLFLAVLVESAHGDAVVSLDNYAANRPIYLMWSPDSQAPNLHYEVLGGAVGGLLRPLIAYGATNSVYTSADPGVAFGFFDAGIAPIPGVADRAFADFVVRAWVGEPGSTYDTAWVKGESLPWTQATGTFDPQASPPLPADMVALEIPGSIGYFDAYGNLEANYYYLNTSVSGAGSLRLEPEPLCSGFKKGTAVTVTAISAEGYVFTRWSNDPATVGNPLTFTMMGDEAIAAVFERAWKLDVSAAGSGSAYVAPALPYYLDGEAVTLIAKPDPGAYFLSWSGGSDGEWRWESTAAIIVNQDLSIQANFGTLPIPPVIIDQPRDTEVQEGTNAYFSVRARGEALTYAWYRNDQPVPGATGAVLGITNIPLSEDGSRWYCRVRNPGGETNSQTVSLRVDGLPPGITRQPVAYLMVTNGAAFQVAVEAAGTDLHYLWYENEPIAGATNATLVIANPGLTGSRRFYCRITNAWGSARSATVLVTLICTECPSVIFTVRPWAPVIAGDSAIWSVYAFDSLGIRHYSYAWFHDGVALIDATNAVLTLPQVSAQDAGNYWCVVENTVSATQSETVALAVIPPPPPVILTQPSGQTRHVGEACVLSVRASSRTPCAYQWQLNSQNLLDETNATLSFLEVQLANAGSYHVIVGNEAGTTASNPAALQVRASPKIQIQPRGVITSDELEARFGVKSFGQPPLSYQWRLNGLEIAGATNDVLWLTNAQPALSGRYTVTVSNSAGSQLSHEAPLVVRVGPQIMSFLPTENSFLLTIKTTVGKSYRVEESLDMRTWSDVLDFTSASKFEEQAVPRSPDVAQVFFRVRVE